MKYNFHTDPSDSWLAVPASELKTLGIAEQISCLSRVKGPTVFLHQDKDLDCFMKAKVAKGETVEVHNVYDWHALPRYYPIFRANLI
jgi:hypothetical protein